MNAPTTSFPIFTMIGQFGPDWYAHNDRAETGLTDNLLHQSTSQDDMLKATANPGGYESCWPPFGDIYTDLGRAMDADRGNDKLTSHSLADCVKEQ